MFLYCNRCHVSRASVRESAWRGMSASVHRTSIKPFCCPHIERTDPELLSSSRAAVVVTGCCRRHGLLSSSRAAVVVTGCSRRHGLLSSSRAAVVVTGCYRRHGMLSSSRAAVRGVRLLCRLVGAWPSGKQRIHSNHQLRPGVHVTWFPPTTTERRAERRPEPGTE